MIVEMRTYQLKPRSVPEVEKRFAEALPARVKLSPMAGFWHTEVGPLNTIIHLWTYEDMNERLRIRTEAVAVMAEDSLTVSQNKTARRSNDPILRHSPAPMFCPFVSMQNQKDEEREERRSSSSSRP